ncbi:MAG: sugar kinase [Treponema sp.]|jgi:NAD kinase|nr:sugar kinase [Treponema sp.]
MKKIENRIVIVVRETRLEKVLAAQNTVSQAKFYINQLGGDFEEYETEHNHYSQSVRKARQDLDAIANIQVLGRQYLPNFIFAPGDIVVAVGQDGLVANTLKYLDGQPLIGINPDPARWDGVLLPFKPEDAAKIVKETAGGRRRLEEVTMASAKVQNGQELLAVNDFFIGQKGHASARYIIKYGGVKEPQSSSGVIVSTGLGSTGWMKSVIAGANRISSSVIGRPYGSSTESEELSVEEGEYTLQEEWDDTADMLIEEAAAIPEPAAGPDAGEPSPERGVNFCKLIMPEEPPCVFKSAEPLARKVKRKKSFGISELSSVVGKWSSGELLFAVREPFPSKTTGTNMVFGKITPGETLRIESLMGENGVIFSDGIESDFIAFNSGAEAAITIAGKKGRMVV